MTPTILTLPGLACSGPEHWQTIWEKEHGNLFSRVEQDNWDWPVKGEWVDRLNQYISKLNEPAYLVAHSMGCITVAHWAQEYFSEHIKGALLVAPADADLSKRLSFVVDFRPIPSTRLPFKSIVVASTNDIYATFSRSEKFAADWGSALVNVGAKGHINAVSGLGNWPEGKAILAKLTGYEIG